MNFLILAQAGFNAGDILFQLVAFVFLLTIPAILVIIFFIFKKRQTEACGGKNRSSPFENGREEWIEGN